MKKAIKSVIAALLVVSTLAGCSSFTGTQSSGTAAQGESASAGSGKDSITLYLKNEIPTLNQFSASDNIAFAVLNNISEGLYRLDKENQPQPALAKDVTISDDQLTYTFTLRDGLKWSNGEPLTSKDFQFAWLRQMTADARNNYSFIMTDYITNALEYSEGKATADKVGLEAPDDTTLVVHLKAPTPYFLFLTTFVPYFPQNEAFFQKQGDNFGLGKDNLIYSGPFTISQYDAASGVTLVKNDNYWDADNVKISSAKIKIIKEQSTAMNLYKAGQLDRVELSSAEVPSYKEDPEFSTNTIFRTQFLQINTTAEGTKNVNIRKAISCAIDNDLLANTILNNGSEAAVGVVPGTMSSGVTGKKFSSFQNGLKTFDVAKAKEYWKKGVAELGKEPQLSIVLDDDTETKDVGTFIQSQLKDNLGIDVTLDSKTKEARRTLMKSSDYQMGVNAWGADYDDAMTYIQLWADHSVINGFRGNFIDESYDKAISDAKAEVDTEKRAEILASAEKYLISDQTVIVPLYYMGSAYLTKSNVKDLFVTHAGTLELKHVSVQ
ncbi:MAG: peptide ABC transporter substrate-binding protein [Oscillospiraceae bacterium]|jgi:oligopeptide transport system substrate-binding protein|nr:peptide ABC transporter substrate-binding protein [Oscillospiraceae bacterium]